MPAQFNIDFAARTARNARITMGDLNFIVAMGRWATNVSGTDVEIRNFELVAAGFRYGIAGLLTNEWSTEGAWNFLVNPAVPPLLFPGVNVSNVKLFLRKNLEKWTFPESTVLTTGQNAAMDEMISVNISSAKAAGGWTMPGDIAALPPDV